MADADASLAGAKRKQLDADAVPLLTPSKRFSTGSLGRAKSPSDGATASPSSPLVIARSPSDTSRLWAARIAATQRLARRKGSASSSSSSASRASTAMAAKRRALSLSPAAAGFEASVSITTKVLPKRPKIKTEPLAETPTKPSRRRASTASTPRQVIDLVDDVEMAATEEDQDAAVKKEQDEPKREPEENGTVEENNELVDHGVDLDAEAEQEHTEEPDVSCAGTEETEDAPNTPQTELAEEEQNRPLKGTQSENGSLKTTPEERATIHVRVKTEPVEANVTIKAEPPVLIKVERTGARTERPPLAPTTPRRRALFEEDETEGEAAASTVSREVHEEDEQDADSASESSHDVGDLNERLQALAATLEAEKAEKAALKRQLDEMAAKLRESEERQQHLESQLASLSIGAVSIKQERA